MASVTTVTYLDDIDQKPAAETVQFGLDGVSYEIDLSKKNAAALRKVLGEFVPSARRLKLAKLGAAKANSPASDSDRRARTRLLSAVRTWAADTGKPVASRGRIAEQIIDEYLVANQS